MKENLVHFDEKTEKTTIESQFKETGNKSIYSEIYFRTIVESSLNGIAVLDEQGNFEYVNDSFLKNVGWLREEILGQNFLIIIPEDIHEFAITACNDFQKGANNIHKIKIKTKRGDIKYLNSFHQLINVNGNLKTVSITEDITEEMRLMLELTKSNKHKKLLCYLIKNTRGGKTRALILKNLLDNSYNANQLAKLVGIDYKTTRHHLEVLNRNGIIDLEKDRGNGTIYYISKNLKLDLNELAITK